MAEQYVQNTKYKYDLNASLVIQGGQNKARNENEPTGEGSSLVGKVTAGFGDRAQRSKPVELTQKAVKKLESEQRGKKKELKKHQSAATDIQRPGINVLNVQIEEDLLYRPKSKETRAIYEQMLVIVQRHMGDNSLEVLKGALDEVLAILKAEGVQDKDRKLEIESLLDRIDETEFNTLMVLSQQLTDYFAQGQSKDRANGDEVDEMPVDPEMDFSASESSDFEDVIHVREAGDDVQMAVEQNEQMDVLGEVEAEEKVIQKVDGPRDDKASLSEITLASIEAQWLNRLLTQHINEASPEDVLKLEKAALVILGNEQFSQRECEKKLFGLLGHQKFEVVRVLLKNRYTIYFGTRLSQAQNQQELALLRSQMEQSKHGQALLVQTQDSQIKQQRPKMGLEADLLATLKASQRVGSEQQPAEASTTFIDLEVIKFDQGGRLMSNKKCHLPKGSTKLQKKGYDEIFVPAVKQQGQADGDRKLIPISDLPSWAQKAFPESMPKLNLIQSRLYPAAFKSPENLLVCAPTGAGKTNIAMLSILQILSQKRRQNGTFDLKSFKIVYIAPMKALVSEVVGSFQKRLIEFGISVRELTGDVHLTRAQIDETQIIVTTPEKWDIVTRKSGERAYIDLVKLIIIDEIHLLHDSRGPVLEAIVSRTMRQIEQTSELVRIVALSATLPNYKDVAAFLRVKPDTGLFVFDQTYRPVPLEQVYVGITEKKAIKRMMLMNEICYEKVMERAGKHQVLIFSHSRKETARTAKIIRDMALAQNELGKFVKEDSASKEILLSQVEKCDSQDLKDVLPFGLGIHHAGMTKRDRKMVEDLFASGYLQVLCSTATLAWGVNLPAHTVIIKGTQIYSPEQGKWIELSPQDVLQMMGRAGRPQYDTLGEGIIITNHTELQYYLSMNNMQLPIESQMISQLADQLCAEVVLGTVSSIKEAVSWIAYTYLYVRMLRNPQLYGVQTDDKDPTLVGRRTDLVHSAATLLSRSSMIKYDKLTGSLQATALGKIASHYYIKHQSMQVYSENLKPHMNLIDIFRLFALSNEFKFVPIRENEKLELQKFVERVPIPVKGTLEEPATKINILLQAYISRFKLEGYDLNSDMVYVTQSASRIMRALFEICLRRQWSQLSQTMLNLCKMVDKRLWSSMTPLRQFTQMPNVEEISRKIEKKAQFQWHHFYDMNAQQIGEIVSFPKMGKIILNQIHKFPRLELEAYVQPVTRTLVRIELDLKAHASFTWDQRYHGNAEPFWIIVEDCDSEQILHSEQFILKQNQAKEEHRVSFYVPLHDPLPPQYFVKVISDRWLQSQTSLPISFKHLLLPHKFSPPTQLQDFYPKLVSDLNFEEVEKLYRDIDGMKDFNPIQTQAFDKLYLTDESVFLGAPSGSNLLVCAELAMFRELQSEDGGKILYIAPNELLCKSVFANWKRRLQHELGLNITMLDDSQNFSQQSQAIQNADIVLATTSVWETISRRWRQRRVLHQITLVIFDQLQLLTPEYEVVASRVRLMQSELKAQQAGKKAVKPIRIISLSCPIANGRDVAMWLGVDVDSGAYFNFSPAVRPQPIEATVQSFDQFNRPARLLAMAKPAYNQIKKHFRASEASEKGCSGIVFVSDRKQARLTALDFVTYTATDDNPDQFKGRNIDSATISKVSEQSLASTLEYGIGILHDGLTAAEVALVKRLYSEGAIRLIVISQQFCWEVSEFKSNIVILMDVEKYDGAERRFIEYPVPDVLQMQSLANQTLQTKEQKLAPKFLLMCYTPRKDYFVKFIQEPLPIESGLADALHDPLNAEIVAGTVTSKQDAVDWLTWTFMYRRLAPNPNYYNLSGRTPQHINDFLSQLIEETVEDLQASKCIVVAENELDIEPGNIGRIASFYGVKYQTIGLFAKHLEDEAFLQKKMRGLISLICQASEFSQMPIRDGEEPLLRQLAQYLTYPVFENQQTNKDGDLTDEHDINQPHAKTNILLQCHFNRRPLSVDLRLDQKFILEQSVKLVHAMVDVISTNGHLNATLLAMELSQMIVQAMWPKQSPLLQLPGFNGDLVETLRAKAKVEEIPDFMNMEDDLREKLVQVSEEQMERLATVCNRYPIVEIRCSTDRATARDSIGVYAPGEAINLTVVVSRDEADEDALSVFKAPVFAQYFPQRKFEEWWVVVGSTSSGRLLAIKKISNFREQAETQTQLEFTVERTDFIKENVSIADLKVFLVCDSYIGCDLQEQLQVKLTM